MHAALRNPFNQIHATLLLHLFIYPFGIYTYFVRVYVCDVTGLKTYSLVFLLIYAWRRFGFPRSFLRREAPQPSPRLRMLSAQSPPPLIHRPPTLSKKRNEMFCREYIEM